MREAITVEDGDVHVSVILPCRNAVDTLGEQLAALAGQDFSEGWEVVLVDDGCGDGTAALAEGWRPHLPSLTVTATQASHNVAHARNVGVAASRGSLLLFCDADDVVAPGWVRAMVHALQHADLAAGVIEVEKLNGAWAKHTRQLPQRYGLQEWDPPFLPHAGGGNLGVRREVWDAVGPFDDSGPLRFAEAADYCFRAQLAGYRLVFAPEAVLHVLLRHELPGIYWQARGWAEGSVALHRKFADQGMPAPRRARGLASWGLVPLRLLRVRSRRDLAKWMYMLGWRVGRLRGSARSRMLAP